MRVLGKLTVARRKEYVLLCFVVLPTLSIKIINGGEKSKICCVSFHFLKTRVDKMPVFTQLVVFSGVMIYKSFSFQSLARLNLNEFMVDWIAPLKIVILNTASVTCADKNLKRRRISIL